MGDSRQMDPDGSRDEEPSEPTHIMHDEHKDAREETARERNGASEEGESKINDAVGDVTDAYGGDAVLPGQQPVLIRQQQALPPHLGSTVRWERFLPFRSLNVLLVENDDSTRHLVSALLRNCGYEVIAVADALQAWETLEDVKTRVDLVLTEVAMPCLSGVGLLTQIVSHRTYKNIPVIMMSSNDSMGVVFKCFSKGAADFLVKPIRKNELKNLWQHVWRRCHSSSGSGSESGIQGHKISQSNSPTDSDNNTGSNDDDDDGRDQNGNFGLNLRDGSDNGSGTQNSWTKRAVEDDSPQPVSPSDQLADPHDSSCAQVTHPKLDMFLNDWVPSMNNECLEHKEFADKKFAENMVLPWSRDKKHASCPTEKVSTEVTSPKVGKLPEHIQKPEVDESVRGESSNASCGANMKVAGLIGGIATNCEAQASRVTDIPDGFSKISSCKDKPVEDSKELPSLALSLKRLRSRGDGDDQNVLRHSDLSAFSWYNNSTASPRSSKGYGGGCSIPHDNSEAIKAECTSNMLNTMSMNKSSNGSSYNNDMGSTTKDAFPKPGTYKDKAASPSTVKNIHNLAPHTWPHVTPAIQPMMEDKVDDVAVVAMAEQTRMQHQVQVEHHHHHYHHHHYHVHGMEKQQQQQQPPPGNDDMSLKNMAAAAPQCGSSDMFPGPLEGNAANYSLNGSASGSNYGSNGQNGSTSAVNVVRTNLESDPGVATKNEAGGAVSETDQNRSSQRQAALNKFRQKRKERNFGKKVRYQSRKRLAEQRPRVRGQFVRRTAHEQTNPEAAC